MISYSLIGNKLGILVWWRQLPTNAAWLWHLLLGRPNTLQ